MHFLSRLQVAALLSTFSIVSCGGNSGPSQSPNQVFTVADNAISSMAVEGLTNSKLNPRGYSVTLDSRCGDHGEPLDSSGAQIANGSAEYASQFFYCLAKQPTGGEDSLRGMISLAAGLTCLLKDKLHFNGTPEAMTLTIDGTCFRDSFVAENGTVDATATITASQIGSPLFGDASAWDYSVEIQSDSVGGSTSIDVKLLFKTAPNLYAAAILSNVDGHTNDASSVFIDTSAGVLRYESKNQRYAEGCGTGNCGWNRHNRLLVEGNISSDGTFTTVSRVEGVHGDFDKQTPADSSQFLTIKGNPTDGLLTKNFIYTGDPSAASDFSSVISQCSGGGSCSGNDGIAIATASDMDFLMAPSSSTLTAGATWFNSLAPLSFTTVTTADSQ